MGFKLTEQQTCFLIGRLYPNDKDTDIAQAIKDVLCHGSTLYAAEQAHGLPANSLAAKVRRVRKQIDLIGQVLDH